MSISRRAFLAGGELVSLGRARRADPLAEFRTAFKGTIIVRGDADYDRGRAIASVNPSTDKRPRLIAPPDDCEPGGGRTYVVALFRPGSRRSAKRSLFTATSKTQL
jgi:hypothetical protein